MIAWLLAVTVALGLACLLAARELRRLDERSWLLAATQLVVQRADGQLVFVLQGGEDLTPEESVRLAGLWQEQVPGTRAIVLGPDVRLEGVLTEERRNSPAEPAQPEGASGTVGQHAVEERATVDRTAPQGGSEWPS